MPEPLLTRFMQPLLAGRRVECFELVNDALQQGVTAQSLLCEVVWPAENQVQRLYDDDRISTAIEHVATRINRAIADQLQPHLARPQRRGKRVIVLSADNKGEEIGAQICADLFQSDGWDVFFLGGGVPHDEIHAMVGQHRPELLVIFGADPEAVAATRAMIERIREIGACPTMNVLVSGGIFNRADGLWQEIGADAFAEAPADAVRTGNDLGPRDPASTVRGIVKKRRRKRKTAAAATA
jgi:methanogenic corrinoid protein MtbC1